MTDGRESYAGWVQAGALLVLESSVGYESSSIADDRVVTYMLPTCTQTHMFAPCIFGDNKSATLQTS